MIAATWLVFMNLRGARSIAGFFTMAALRRPSKYLEYLSISSKKPISLKKHAHGHWSGRPQLGKETIVEADHNTMNTQRTSHLIQLTLRMHMAHKGPGYMSSKAKSLQQILWRTLLMTARL